MRLDRLRLLGWTCIGLGLVAAVVGLLSVRGFVGWWAPVGLGVLWLLLGVLWLLQRRGRYEALAAPGSAPEEEAASAAKRDAWEVSLGAGPSVPDGDAASELAAPLEEKASLDSETRGEPWKYSVLPAAPAKEMEPPLMAGPPPDTVELLAVYPVVIPRDAGAPVWAYVFTPPERDEVEEDADLQGRGQGPLVHAPAEEKIALERKAVITATPQCAGLTFDPPSQSAVWHGRWRRFDFHAAVTGDSSLASASGTISFAVEGLLVADIPFAAVIGKASTPQPATQTAAGRLYDAIFPSYSHLDKQIVERLERAYKVLGLTYLRDVTTLRSGERWQPEIQAFIEKADAFQLFWSESAAKSDYVAEEWRAAVRLMAEKKKAETFIRPVYWEEPMPAVPEPLHEIHFAFEPDLRK